MTYRFDTRAIHAGQADDPTTGAVTTPIYRTSTFHQTEPGVNKGFCYARTGNPTRTARSRRTWRRSRARRCSLAFASGMAAIHAVLSLLQPRRSCRVDAGPLRRRVAHLLRCLPASASSSRLSTRARRRQSKRRFVRRRACCDRDTSNPCSTSPTLPAVLPLLVPKELPSLTIRSAHTSAAQPLALSADLIVHSTTKYINSHSDVIGGAVVTDDQGLFEDLKFLERHWRSAWPAGLLAHSSRRENSRPAR